MNKDEALKILKEQIARFNGRSHSELIPPVESGTSESYEVSSPSGTIFQVQIQFFWDDRRGETIRVAGAIDDGGIRALVPLTYSVLVEPKETFHL